MAKRAQLTKAELLAPKTRVIDVGSGCITIKALNAAYAVGLRGRTLGDADIFDLLAHAIVDPEMTADEIGTLPLTLLQPIINAVMEFNGMSEGADDLKKTQPSALLTT